MAGPNFNTLLKNLAVVANQFNDEANVLKSLYLKQLLRCPLVPGKKLVVYHDLLIFLCAHPANADLLQAAEKALVKFSLFLKQKKEGRKDLYTGQGMPHGNILTRFSHDMLQYLLAEKEPRLTLDSYNDTEEQLNQILKYTLPVLERERTSAGLNNKELLEALNVKPKGQLAFLLEQYSAFNQQPFLKDDLFDQLALYTQVQSNSDSFSRAYNRYNTVDTYFHGDLLKKFDSVQLLNTALPAPTTLDEQARKKLVKTIKLSLVLMSRETDPATYMDENSLRLYALERGISVGIYGMTANRQLPLESYVGYTLFKNGYPAAYGGCWVFGPEALFGINIFEAFRGGESGYVMCQLLRVYKQVFDIGTYKVEPYQFGKDNPDGITSGAYWFYHRFGFRSVDQAVHRLSEQEVKKIKSIKNYRSPKKVLLQLAESFLALRLAPHKTLTVTDVSYRFATVVKKQYANQRQAAVEACLANFMAALNLNETLSASEKSVCEELSQLAAALGVVEPEQLTLLKEMVFAKVKDVYQYQQYLRTFLRLVKDEDF